MCIGQFLKKTFFWAEISTPFYGLLKAKKCQKRAFFCKNDVQRSFLVQNDKNFFFLKFYQNCKKRRDVFLIKNFAFIISHLFFKENPFFRLFYPFFHEVL